MDRTLKLVLLSLLLTGVVSKEVSRSKRNVQRILAALNNIHNSGPLGRSDAQQSNPLLEELPIGGASPLRVSPSTSVASGRPAGRLIDNSLPRFTSRNPSQPSFLGQNGGPYRQPLRGALGTSQNAGEQPQSRLYGGRRPFNGLVNSATYHFNSSRPSRFGRNGGGNLQHLRGSLGTLQNIGAQPHRGLFGGQSLGINPALSRPHNLGENGHRTHQNMDDSLEALQNFNRFNSGNITPADIPGLSQHTSENSASNESRDLSGSSLNESGSSGDNSS